MDDFMTGFVAGQDSGDNRNNNGWGDGSWIWAFLILAMFGGGWGGFGGFGGGNGALQGALTRADLCSEFGLNDLQNGVRGVSQDVCDSTFALNNTMSNGFHGVDNAICNLGYQTQQGNAALTSAITNGFHGVDNAICNLGYQTQQGFNSTNIAMMQNQNALSTQIANCCCENRQGQADIKYQMATDTCAIQNTIQNTTRDLIDNQNANTRSILEFMVQSKISALESENQNLRLAASQANQNAVIGAQIDAASANLLRRLEQPAPVPAYPVPNPNAVYYGHYNNWNNGCGCNTGCGCN